jgi:hypothetical protein
MPDDTNEPTPERLAKAGEEGFEDFITDTSRRTKRMLDGSVLDMLASRRSISGDQYTAGMQLFEDWYGAGFAASGVIDPTNDVVDGGQVDHVTDHVLDCAGRFAKALMAVGKVHSGVLVDVVLLEVPLAVFGAKRHGYKDRKDASLAAVVSLRDALTALDHHYHGLRKTRSRSTHTDDYRPTIDGGLDSPTPRD